MAVPDAFAKPSPAAASYGTPPAASMADQQSLSQRLTAETVARVVQDLVSGELGFAAVLHGV